MQAALADADVLQREAVLEISMGQAREEIPSEEKTACRESLLDARMQRLSNGRFASAAAPGTHHLQATQARVAGADADSHSLKASTAGTVRQHPAVGLSGLLQPHMTSPIVPPPSSPEGASVNNSPSMSTLPSSPQPTSGSGSRQATSMMTKLATAQPQTNASAVRATAVHDVAVQAGTCRVSLEVQCMRLCIRVSYGHARGTQGASRMSFFVSPHCHNFLLLTLYL